MRFLRRLLGRALNVLGAPGFIRVSECREQLGMTVEVKVNDLFTTVSVSNLRLLFHRLSGRLDGVVVEPADCTGANDQRS
jgi:hypothetical protein